MDSTDVGDTLQRAITLRQFNKGALGLYDNSNRVLEQLGRGPRDPFSKESLSEQILRIMDEYKLFEKFGLSYTDCLAMKADQWNMLVHSLTTTGIKRSQSSGEIMAQVLLRLEQALSIFTKPVKGKDK